MPSNVWISTKLAAALGVAVMLLSGASVFAHHSFAMFDMQKDLTIEGTVKEVQWTNPHVWIEMMVKDATTGTEVAWSIETDSPSVLARRGWTRKSLQAGDKAVLVIHPLKSKANAGINGGSLATASVNGQRIGTPALRPPDEAK
jgi:hypothetical protein